jgi:hypothetical protein
MAARIHGLLDVEQRRRANDEITIVNTDTQPCLFQLG